MIVPSILATSKKEYVQKLRVVEKLVQRVHIDIMDGRFVHHKTIQYRTVASVSTTLQCDFHVMVADPLRYVKQFLSLGYMFTIHVESFTSEKQLLHCISFLRKHKKKVCLALNPRTSLTRIMPYVSRVDHVLCMTVQ